MKMDDFVANESVRGWAYKLLADCYQRPDDEITKKIIDLTDALKDICPLGASYMAFLASKLQKDFNIDHIRLDYARLFLGPFAVPAAPYGSVYLEGKRQLMGNSTLDVLERYRLAGLKISSDFNELPDHIAVELEFMSFLIFKAIESSGNSDAVKMIDFYESQKSFLKDHLGAWAFEFAAAVEKNAATEFYQNLAQATKAFLKNDCQVFSTILAAKHSEKTMGLESMGKHC
jgi:TorA maturation chaperone TorD